ncbi:MAG: Sec-independent protein translocase TatE [Verrucomicrobiales bacterium]|nr:Sec-independent protein translocase TatE [Verrucomicrobiales bacterium]
MIPMLAIFGMGGGEIILILVVVLLLFGAKKMPELAKGLGQGIREFKKASREVTEEIQHHTNDVEDDHYRPPSNLNKQLTPQTTDIHVTAEPVVEPNTIPHTAPTAGSTEKH